MLIDNYANDDNYLNRIMEFANKETRVQKKKENLFLNNNIKEFKLSNNINNNNNKILITGDRYIPYKNNIENIQNFILNSSPFNNNSSSSLSSIETKPEKNYVNFIIDNMLKNSSEDYIIRNNNLRQNNILKFSKIIYNTTSKYNQRKKSYNNDEDLNNNNLNLTIRNNKNIYNNEFINEIDNDINNKIFKNISDFIELNKKRNVTLDNILTFDRKYNNRRIQKTPIRILDAPNLIDDFYLNILDWGKENIIAVSLYDEIYLWDDNNYQTSLLMAYKNKNINNSIRGNNIISSLSFMNNGIILGVGLPDGNIQLWDINKKSKLREIDGHEDRVSCLSWNEYILSSGSKDKFIKNFDVRIKNAEISKIKKHKQEICSLKYSKEGDLLASGGNDNVVYIWDIRNLNNNIYNFLFEEHNNNYNYNCSEIKLYSLNIFHQAAIKAMAWCPWKRHVLATGGGSKDKSIKIYSCDSNKLLKNINTGSQVCALLWNQKEKEIISSHGYNKNQIIIWNYEKNKKISELKGHMNRVLYLAISPDETLICSGSGDETLRLWRINDMPIKNYEEKNNIYKNIIVH